jgi:hypothetical protein
MGEHKPARQHHYIPRFYLKGFAQEPLKDSPIHVFDMTKGKWLPATHPTNLGTVRDFNRVDIDGQPIDVLESFLSKFETEASRVLESVRESKSMPAGDDLIILMNLVAMISVRHPQVRESFRESTKKVIDLTTALSLANKERFESTVQEMKRAGFTEGLPDVSYEELLQFYQSGEYNINIKNQFFYSGEFVAIRAVVQTLLNRRWSFLIAGPEAGHFISSDHPVRLRWTDPKLAQGYYPPGHGVKSTEVLFPLSSNTAIVGTFESEDRTEIVNKHIIAMVNTLILQGCVRHLYSPTDDFFYLGKDRNILSSVHLKPYRHKRAQ